MVYINFFHGAEALHSPGIKQKIPPDAGLFIWYFVTTLDGIHKNPFMPCSLIHIPQASNLQQMH